MAVADSYRVSAPSVSMLDYVQAIETHISNTSTKFSVGTVTDDTGGSGDYGFTFTADDAAETWEGSLYYDSTNNDIRAFLDPQASITSAIDPTSGSTQTSPVNGPWIRDLIAASYTPDTEFLISELNDCLLVVFKHSDQSDAHDFGMIGRIYIPAWTNDPSHDLDGLGVQGKYQHMDDTVGAYRVGTTDWINGKNDDSHVVVNRFSDGRIRPSRVGLVDDRSTSSLQILGHYKYYMFWKDDNNAVAMERIDDGTDEGYLTITDSFGNLKAIPWDTSLQPS